MKNFKPGQKVVFKNVIPPGFLVNPFANEPKDGDIVTIKERCKEFLDETYIIVEYPFSLRGKCQVIQAHCLFPIEEKKQVVTVEIKKIKLEPKKVLGKTEELLTAN